MKEDGQMILRHPRGLINLYSEYFSLDPLFFTERVKHASVITLTKTYVLYFGARFEILTKNS